MTSPGDPSELPLEVLERLDEVCARFEAAWQGGLEPRIEDYLGGVDEPERRLLFRELFHAEVELRRARGLPLPEAPYRERFPEYADLIGDPNRTCDELSAARARRPRAVPPAGHPERIARYRIVTLLGQGGFGSVYLAYDDRLNRQVAVKVPHARLVSRPEDAEPYLAEARNVARLDHPNIVPVYDVGSTERCPCYVVTKYVGGTDLARRLRQQRPSPRQAAELVATVAEALHCAHQHGLVHRDVKPGNILIDPGGTPYLVDFGLALRDEDVGTGSRYVGTPAYMSPEQARGEGHRVDGRSDVFSLGVVFYELLAGRKPFRADTTEGLLEQIASAEARPPRQLDDSIPRELERICLKALANRALERYPTAKDLAADLRQFLADQTAQERSGGSGSATTGTPGLPSRDRTPNGSVCPSPGEVLKIVPRGLRSFDAHDADFFPELLPGPRDRSGLPESLRLWKTHAEETDGDETFAVGLIYGPSGCGKSSLVKAGLLPRLAGHVLPVYVEATADETEARLLHGLRKRCPDLPGRLGLKEALAALRRGQGLPAGKKVLLVLDQFEQWLHARQGQGDPELIQALRQCDGGRVQAVLLVRDDFWLAVSRFLADLEAELVQGRNTALVDLFDPRHARKVLAAFGRAFGTLPEGDQGMSEDQAAFLDQAVAGLAQGGKVVPVRLAVFAEVVKGRPWTPATLKEIGGSEGAVKTFLEETFSSPAANPRHRLHQRAAQAVLKALLPEAGTDIKGHQRSRQELREASGYADRPQEFEELLRILDRELHLITPTDPEGLEMEGQTTRPATGEGYYQLTHDYLVPSLRDWLNRKQKETRRGRAELRLADYAADWTARPENRRLPSLLPWLTIWWLIPRKDRTAAEQKMMRKAARCHAARGAVLTLALAALLAAGLVVRGRIAEQKADHAAGLVRRLLDAETDRVPWVVAEMEGYRAWTDPLLRDEYRKANPNSREQLHASLALLPVDRGQVEPLYGRLLDADPHEVPVIRGALTAHRSELLDKLWGVAQRPAKGREAQRLRAASALATYASDDPRWARIKQPVAADLVGVPGGHLAAWMESLRPVRLRLLAPLLAIVRDARRRESERSQAIDVLAEYAADRPEELADLLMDADEKQFATLFPKLRPHRERGPALLLAELDKHPHPAWDASPLDPAWADLDAAAQQPRERLARRQANAAVALLRLGHPEKVWPLLRHRPDPRVRSYLLHRLSPFGADPRDLIRRLEEEKDVSARRALLLSVGEFGEAELSPARRGALLPKLLDLYRNDPDPGLHGAAAWLLGQWGQKEMVQAIERELATSGAGHQTGENFGHRGWYVNGQGQTYAVIPGPVEFTMGSPRGEVGRVGGPEGRMETLHRKRIGRSFALAMHEVTVQQFLAFRETHDYGRQISPTPDCPVNQVTWHEAARYCNWLSEQEKIPQDQWCYEPDPGGKDAGAMRAKADCLRLAGYRLPTEAEWEYACRAGAVTRRYYGETDELLGKYAWHILNSQERQMLPVGSLRPNDLGLFEALGNALEWTHDPNLDYTPGPAGGACEDKGREEAVTDERDRVTRSGSYLIHPGNVRAAFRRPYPPGYKSFNLGLRPARTLTGAERP